VRTVEHAADGRLLHAAEVVLSDDVDHAEDAEDRPLSDAHLFLCEDLRLVQGLPAHLENVGLVSVDDQRSLSLVYEVLASDLSQESAIGGVLRRNALRLGTRSVPFIK